MDYATEWVAITDDTVVCYYVNKKNGESGKCCNKETDSGIIIRILILSLNLQATTFIATRPVTSDVAACSLLAFFCMYFTIFP